MRKRAHIKSKPVAYEPKQITEIKPKRYEEKPLALKKNWWVALSLISIFLLVLFFNTYFNMSSEIAIYEEGDDFSKYLLSGPDPYYNMRLVKETYETGQYPYYSDSDPLLNYPLGARGARAPLLNMMALGFSRLLTPFMEEIDAIGYAMQFIPALFGALLIFPIYLIGKTLFNKKAGLIAAFFLVIIPIHIGSGHGSAYSLFDHDSFNLLLFFLTFLFLILSLKEKDHWKSILYAILAGVPLAGLSMTWVEAQFLYVIIAGYAIVQMIIDIFTNKIEINAVRATSIALLAGYLISFPVTVSKPAGFIFDTPLLTVIVVLAFGLLYYIFGVKKIPWTLSLPFIFITAGVGLGFIYFAQNLASSFNFLSGLGKLAEVIFGTGIYGNKVSMTIAEANTYQISHTVMSLGPAIYWVGWMGFIFLIWYYYREKLRRDYLFFIVLFIVDLWLTGTAGRFLNDMVPLIAIFAGFITWYFASMINYKQMLRNIKSAGGGLHGIRRGIKFMHLSGVLLIAFAFILPSAFVTFDAAVPSAYYKKDDLNMTNLKLEMFGEGFSGAFGLTLYKESYWTDALDWLSQQDTHIENDTDRPAFISWWDYGFYEVALGEHPTVADNFQDGIPPASNFHTSTSEKDAVTVWCVRLLEGDKRDNDGKLSENVKSVLRKHLGNEIANNIVKWMENHRLSPSYGKYIREEYNQYIQEDIDKQLLTIGAQWPINAVYQDVVNLFNNETEGGYLTEEQLTWLYHDLQEATGYSIRYYGVEGYDRQIFNIFAFLSDKSLVLMGTPEDEFVEVMYDGYEVNPDGTIKRSITNEPFINYLEMTDDQKKFTAVNKTSYNFKNEYFDTMFYRTYIGPFKEDSTTGNRDSSNFQVPCIDMKHFYAEFISNPLEFYYNAGQGAVVISKYYEGAFINGSVNFNGKKLPVNVTIVVRKNLSYVPGDEGFDTPIDYDSDEFIATENESDSNFSLIAGEGAHISVIRNPEIRHYEFGVLPFVLKNVEFNGETGTDYAPISEDDAMRKQNSNYERFINITIDPANVEGYVYDDIVNDGEYNKSQDQPSEGLDLYFFEIEKFNPEQINQGQLQPDEVVEPAKHASTDENGYYNLTNLLPGYYALNVYDEKILVNQQIVALKSGNTTLDIIKYKKSSVSGITYYDEDADGEFKSGVDKIIDDAFVELQYVTYISGIPEIVDISNTTSSSNGSYSFTDVPAGNYIITATKLNEYNGEVPLELLENTSEKIDVSMMLTPIPVSGVVKHLDDPVEGATITFEIDSSVEDNTAVENTATTVSDGSYSIDLQPGSYNVSIEKIDDETLVYTLEGEKISLGIGDEPVTKNFSPTKKTATISGTTSYEGTRIDNVTIEFVKDTLLENNTAETRLISSDENGRYTVELIPGIYNIMVDQEKNESGIIKTYTFNENTFVIPDISDITKNIELVLKEES